ncbi:hypothetical protein [uncultured Cetobacterium sp.]|uniref:hypothetical protein n=1 Tax=uncultured Cetobacterium sp. TaxID=527638 RepID=UPI0026242CA6|nr:hypothetical protein [uncultured Cetobacterium sp.]
MKLICKDCNDYNRYSGFKKIEKKMKNLSSIRCCCCGTLGIKKIPKSHIMYERYKDVDTTHIIGNNNIDRNKVNVPSTISKFNSKNGEGMWCCGITEDDRNKLNDDNYFGLATVVILNDCFEHLTDLLYLDVIDVQCNGSKRATITKEFFDYLNKDIVLEGEDE